MKNFFASITNYNTTGGIKPPKEPLLEESPPEPERKKKSRENKIKRGDHKHKRSMRI